MVRPMGETRRPPSGSISTVASSSNSLAVTFHPTVDRNRVDRMAASTSQMRRFETEWPAMDHNMAGLTNLSGAWIDRVHDRMSPKMIVLDMDSPESPTDWEQEAMAYRGHFGCNCYHPLFLFNQFGDLERSLLLRSDVHSAEDWRVVLEPVIARYRSRKLRRYFRADAAFANLRSTRSWRPRISSTSSAFQPTGCSRTASPIC